MLDTLKSFDPKKALLTIGGVPIDGYADGTYVNFSWPNNLWETKEGGTGEVDRIKIPTGFRADLEITLMQSADINSLLWALMEADFNFNDPFPILFKDLLGPTTLECSKCYNTKPPAYTLEKGTPSNRVWTFTLPKVIGLMGGN
jgi:hypothetical protein